MIRGDEGGLLLCIQYKMLHHLLVSIYEGNICVCSESMCHSNAVQPIFRHLASSPIPGSIASAAA